MSRRYSRRPKPSRFAALRERLHLGGTASHTPSRHDRDELLRRGVWVLAAVLVVVIIGVLGFGYWRENIQRGQETAASVYGQTITLNDLVPWAKPRVEGIEQAMAFYNAQGLSQQAVQLQFQLQSLPDQVLSERVEGLLVKREADQRGLSVSDEELDAKLHELMAQQAAQNAPLPTTTPTAEGQAAAEASASPVGTPAPVDGATAAAEATAAATSGPPTPPAAGASPAATETPAGTPTPTLTPTPVPTLSPDSFKVTYEAFLDRTGYTDAQYRQIIRESLLQDKLQKAIGAQIPEVQEQIHARMIQVADKATADDIVNKLDSGEKFEDLAKSQSTDSTSKDKGGDLGWLPRGIMGDAWDAAAFGLQPGQRSGPVEIPGRGVVIIEVIEKSPARPLTDDQLTQLRSDAYDKWLTQAKAAPEVKVETLTDDQRAYVLRKAGAPKSG